MKSSRQLLASTLVALCAILPLTGLQAKDSKAPPKAEQVLAKVNINTADAKTLAKTLKGVGLKKAQAIVAHRKQLGGKFKSTEQLLEIKGIGKKLFAKLKPQLTL